MSSERSGWSWSWRKGKLGKIGGEEELNELTHKSAGCRETRESHTRRLISAHVTAFGSKSSFDSTHANRESRVRRSGIIQSVSAKSTEITTTVLVRSEKWKFIRGTPCQPKKQIQKVDERNEGWSDVSQPPRVISHVNGVAVPRRILDIGS